MQRYRWLLGVLFLALGASVPSLASAQTLRPGLTISSVTTTVIAAAVAGKTVGIVSGSVCIDADGATTGITYQDTTGVNVVGPGITYRLGAGQCQWFPTRIDPYFTLTAPGTGLQIVTTTAGGPVRVYLELVQR